MRTSSRNFVVLLFDEVEVLDFAGAVQVASVAGRHWNWRPFKIMTTASCSGLVETRNQLKIEAGTSLAECPPSEILLIPGGYGARLAARDPSIVDWCRTQAFSADRVIVVGSGAAIACAADLLSNAEVATTKDNAGWLEAMAPDVTFRTDLDIADSGKLLTVAHGAASVEAGLRLVEHCLGKGAATKLRPQFSLAEDNAKELTTSGVPRIIRT